ncbi:MAG TPA: hypothetical protein VF378_07540 [Geothrix sp.]
MNKPLLAMAFLLSLGATNAGAQVRLRIDLGLPVAPPLVLVQPGVQVVEGFGEEVFFHNGWYWCRRPDGWYRARSPRASFAWIEERRVPGVLVRAPIGHYRNWRHDRPVERWETGRREEHREIRKEERREERRDLRKDERREERRDQRKDERREERHDERREH